MAINKDLLMDLVSTSRQLLLIIYFYHRIVKTNFVQINGNYTAHPVDVTDR